MERTSEGIKKMTIGSNNNRLTGADVRHGRDGRSPGRSNPEPLRLNFIYLVVITRALSLWHIASIFETSDANDESTLLYLLALRYQMSPLPLPLWNSFKVDIVRRVDLAIPLRYL